MITPRLNEITNILADTGIFSALNSEAPELPFLDSINAPSLDREYYLGRSGNKRISLLYYNLLDSRLNALKTLAGIILNKFGDNWNKLYNAMIIEYNPIENYSMTEKENIGSKVINSSSVANDVYGFNSDTSVKANENTATSTTEGAKKDNERELKRSGNIGVTTSQQMLMSEIDIRTKNKFYDMIMKDIDSVLCSPYYN